MSPMRTKLTSIPNSDKLHFILARKTQKAKVAKTFRITENVKFPVIFNKPDLLILVIQKSHTI